jgi:plasmid stability protein
MTPTKDVNIRIDAKTYRKLKIRAAKHGISLKECVAVLADAA